MAHIVVENQRNDAEKKDYATLYSAPIAKGIGTQCGEYYGRIL